MKVALGHQVHDGPWGGGNQFARALADALTAAGHQVVFDLKDGDIDIILVTDPRFRNPVACFTHGHAFRYLLLKNRRAIVVHRINECDERKNTHGMNWRLRLANYCADHTVFIASWLKDLAVWHAGDGRSHSVILNGGDRTVFNDAGHTDWDGSEPLKLVTHHWGGNWLKGFDVYQALDRMLADPAWHDRIEFTYIGNVPDGFTFENATHLQPLSGHALADQLRRHHVYITGSVNEPGGMHHIEGALCGLPLLYRNSGALPEYGRGFGLMFEDADFVPALEAMMNRYGEFRAALKTYPYTAERMCGQYIGLFEELLARRDDIIARRRLLRAPVEAAFAQLPV